MEQIKTFVCGKIVLCQAYDHMLETLPPGVNWQQYGFYKCITTTETQKKYINDIMKNVSTDVLTPNIPEAFFKKDKPSKPIIAIHTREPRDTAKIIKTFYLKYPQYRWITFRDMRGITQKDFAKFLRESFVSVWVDRESGFGTFPIESMISNTPVIGVVPNLKPDWMNENNGIWTYSFNEIIDVLANFAQNWLEDNINEELYTKMSETGEKYQNKESFDNKIESLFVDYFNVRKEMFSQQLEKLKITEEK
jgi:glycosyltransferase involved in cell wall biosynthesis